MTDDAAARFMAPTLRDRTVADTFDVMVPGRALPNCADDIVRFAENRGFAFDRDEVLRVRVALAAWTTGSGLGVADLTDDALEPVHGGVFGPLVAFLHTLEGGDAVQGDTPFDARNRNFWLP